LAIADRSVDGRDKIATARHNIVATHHNIVHFCDSFVT